MKLKKFFFTLKLFKNNKKFKVEPSHLVFSAELNLKNLFYFAVGEQASPQ